VAAWRQIMRTRPIAVRRAVPAAARAAATTRVAAALDALLPDPAGRVISICRPFRGEPDLRNRAATAIGRGARIARPEVVEHGAPLVFRPWRPGAALRRAVWYIPVPDTAEQIRPEILVAPVVGFDMNRVRLGHGGGFSTARSPACPRRLRSGSVARRNV